MSEPAKVTGLTIDTSKGQLRAEVEADGLYVVVESAPGQPGTAPLDPAPAITQAGAEVPEVG